MQKSVFTNNNSSRSLSEDEFPTRLSLTGDDVMTQPVPVPEKTESVRWQSWSQTDTGKRRKLNEDSLLDKPEAGLWVVADGMGGHKAGDVASQLIVSTLNKVEPTSSLESRLAAVEKGLQHANAELRHYAEKNYGNHIVGSTVVALICEQDRCAFLWAGDSRLYRLRDNKLMQLTHDHCAEEDLEPLESGWAVKSSNIITRAVGADDRLDLDCEIMDIQLGDTFLLCTDGLDKEISFNELEQIMQTHAHHEIVDILVNKTLEYGARDNVTIIVVEKAHT